MTKRCGPCSLVPQSRGLSRDHAISCIVGMRHTSLLPNVISYKCTISACEKVWQCQHALSLFAKTRHQQVSYQRLREGPSCGYEAHCFAACRYQLHVCFQRLCQRVAMAARTGSSRGDVTQLFAARRHQLQLCSQHLCEEGAMGSCNKLYCGDAAHLVAAQRHQSCM